VNLTLPTDSALLTATASDPDGSIASFLWSQVSGPNSAILTNPNMATVIVSNLVQGTYQFRVVVTDDRGATAQSTVKVMVAKQPTNMPPTVTVGANQTIQLPTNSVTLTGSGTDTDGSIASYAWAQISGPAASTLTNANQATATASGLVAGTYVFRLTVSDNGGATGTASTSVTVNAAPVNIPPVANAGADVSITLPQSSVTLNGSGADSDGSIASYMWTQVSGPNTATLAGSASYKVDASGLVAGTYVFRLTVTDNGGATGTDTVSVNVASAVGSTETFSSVSTAFFIPKCVSCHGAVEPKGLYDLSTYGTAITRVVPNNSAGSVLYQRITSATGHHNVPITQSNKDMIRDWINQGAPN